MSYLGVWRNTGVFLRIVRQHASRNRTLNAAFKAASATGRSFGRVAHQLWLEVVGTVFLAMSVFGASAFVREYAKYHSGRATPGRLMIALCFTITFGWFGLTSFLRVRKKVSK